MFEHEQATTVILEYREIDEANVVVWHHRRDLFIS